MEGKWAPDSHGLDQGVPCSCCRYVYDGELEQQMYMLFDANKKLLATGDIYPAAVQLAKGEYTLRLLLRHDSAPLLDKFRALPLVSMNTFMSSGTCRQQRTSSFH